MIYFNRYSVAKYFFVRDNCNTGVLSDAKKSEFLECSLLGISEKDQFHYITDVIVPKQECTSVTTDIDNADHILFRLMLEDRELPHECGQLWLHTHPGSSANPSSTDLTTWKDMYTSQEKPFGAMGIIASSNGKNCTYAQIMYDSIIGRQTHDCDMLFEAYPDKWVGLEYVFDMEEVTKTHGAGSIHETLFADFANHHEEWLQEIKNNVKEHVVQPTNHFIKHGGYISQYASQYGNAYTSHYVPDSKKKNQIGTSQTTTQTTTATTPRSLPIEKLLFIYIKNNKESLNEFSKSEQQQILSHLGVTQSEFEAVQQQLKKNEKAYTVEDVFDWEIDTNSIGGKYPDLVDYTTMTNLAKSFDSDKFYLICSEVLIRPSRLVELVDEYIKHMKTGKKIQHGHK